MIQALKVESMITKYLFTIEISFIIAQPVLAQINIFNGEWTGEISKDNKAWRTEINLAVDGKTIMGYSYVPDYGLYHFV